MRTPQIQKASLYAHVILAGEYQDNKRKEVKRNITLEDILLDVCEVFNEEPINVQSKSRKRHLVTCRSIFCFVASKVPNVTLKEMGRLLNGRDHTTCIFNRDKVADFLKVCDPSFMDIWDTYIENSKVWGFIK